jgi:hypothetical protein
LDDSSDDQIALTIKLPDIEENLLDLSSMELPDGKKTLPPDFYEATIKPSTRSGLDTRLLVDTFICITMFLVLIMMTPSLAEAAPVPELMITEVLEYTKKHNADLSHPKIEIDTEKFSNFVMTNAKTRSVFPVIPRCLGRIPEELNHENAT